MKANRFIEGETRAKKVVSRLNEEKSGKGNVPYSPSANSILVRIKAVPFFFFHFRCACMGKSFTVLSFKGNIKFLQRRTMY